MYADSDQSESQYNREQCQHAADQTEREKEHFVTFSLTIPPIPFQLFIQPHQHGDHAQTRQSDQEGQGWSFGEIWDG